MWCSKRYKLTERDWLYSNIHAIHLPFIVTRWTKISSASEQVTALMLLRNIIWLMWIHRVRARKKKNVTGVKIPSLLKTPSPLTIRAQKVYFKYINQENFGLQRRIFIKTKFSAINKRNNIICNFNLIQKLRKK